MKHETIISASNSFLQTNAHNIHSARPVRISSRGISAHALKDDTVIKKMTAQCSCRYTEKNTNWAI